MHKMIVFSKTKIYSPLRLIPSVTHTHTHTAAASIYFLPCFQSPHSFINRTCHRTYEHTQYSSKYLFSHPPSHPVSLHTTTHQHDFHFHPPHKSHPKKNTAFEPSCAHIILGRICCPPPPSPHLASSRVFVGGGDGPTGWVLFLGSGGPIIPRWKIASSLPSATKDTRRISK